MGREVDRLAAERMAERIREAVGQQEFDLGEGHGVRLACSIGFAFYPFIPSSPTLIKAEQVVTIADRALYVAKTSGRNAWVGIFSTPRASLEDVLSVINKQNDLGTLEGKVEIQSSIVPSTLVPDRQGVVAADRSPILG